MDFLTGRMGADQAQLASQVVRVIVAGNSVRDSIEPKAVSADVA